VVEEVDLTIGEGFRQAVTGPVDRQHPVRSGQRGEDRHPFECAVAAAVDEE
jgi:hypothetical protein